MDRGKAFEEDFTNGCKNVPDLSLDRLKDPMGGFKGQANICDFILYKHPHQIYLELKSRKGQYLYIGGSSPDITDTQFKGLLAKSKIPGVRAGVLVEYSSFDAHFYFDIATLNVLINSGYKSIKYSEAQGIGTPVFTTKRRTRFDIDVDTLLKSIG